MLHVATNHSPNEAGMQLQTSVSQPVKNHVLAVQLPPVNVLGSAQAIYGNQAVLRMLSARSAGAQTLVQRKADLRTLSHSNSSPVLLQRKCACDESSGGCSACAEQKPEIVQRRAVGVAGSRMAAVIRESDLLISEPGDESEQEADQVAHEVIRNLGQAPRSFAIRAKPRESTLPRRPGPADGTGEPPLTPSVGAQIRQALGGGRTLPETIRKPLELRFGYNLGQVRIHTGASAQSASRRLQASAFTLGSNVFFNVGEYNAETANGRALLVHELVHVIQQGGGTSALRSIQRAKISYRKLTWADFKKDPPDDIDFAAETASTFDPVTDKTKKSSEKTRNKCQLNDKSSTEFKATVASDPAVFDKIKPYMIQEESWVKKDKKDNGAKFCKAESELCETSLDETAASVKEKCEKVVADCKQSFEKPDTGSFTLGEGDDQVTANTAADCEKDIFKKCQADAMKQADHSLTDEDGTTFATAKKKSDCKRSFKTDCVTHETAATAALLKHEQGHFDITKVMADKAKASLKAKAATLTATEVGCGKTAATDAAQATFDALDASTVLSSLQQDWIDSMNQAQSDYDDETNHGLKKAEQATWLTEIAGGLKKYDPTAPPPPATQPAGPSGPTSAPAPTP
jgi:hypothetical protein